MRYCSDRNPHVLHESLLHPKKISVWCGLRSRGVIGPYFFRDDQDRHINVNGNRYRSMISKTVFVLLKKNFCSALIENPILFLSEDTNECYLMAWL